MKKYLLVGASKKKKLVSVHGIALEQDIRTDYELGDIENMLEKNHNTNTDPPVEVTLKPKKAGVFTHKGWFGKVKAQYIFFDLIKPIAAGTIVEPLMLKPFNPTNMWSTEKAGLMIHETVTRRGLKGMVPKLTGGVSIHGNRKLMFILMFVAVIGALVAHFVLKIF